MSFMQSFVVIICILVCLWELFLFISLYAIPVASENLHVAFRWFSYWFIPATLSSAYLLHLATGGVQ